jgi:predicted amidohydrolase
LLLVTAAAAGAAYVIWRRRQPAPPAAPRLHLQCVTSFGQDAGAGNLVAVQPYMQTTDYATPQLFLEKLDGYLATAQRQGWLLPNTVVLFPEYIGTWLVATGEAQRLYEKRTLAGALQLLVLRNLLPFLITLPRARGVNRVQDAVFRLKARLMARTYQNAFSHLAQRYGVTVVAGSIILPHPAIRDGRIWLGNGPLQNVSVVFRPDGTLHDAVVRKVYPLRDELPFARGASPTELPVFDTPVGRLGVLICADSWYGTAYDALASQGVDLILVPNFLTGDEIWDRPWRGYDPGPPPPDVDARDVGRLTEGEAWLKYALAGRMARSGARAGLHAFLRGRLWDLRGDGHTIVVTPDGVLEAPRVRRAALVNYWLPPV